MRRPCNVYQLLSAVEVDREVMPEVGDRNVFSAESAEVALPVRLSNKGALYQESVTRCDVQSNPFSLASGNHQYSPFTF